MPKFSIGDVIVNKKPQDHIYDRVVIGNSSDGQVVYEYRMTSTGDLLISFYDENAFVLKPTKKEVKMAKFKIGDSIVPIKYAANYERIVIGTTSNGRVVYEYRDNLNSICIGDGQEDIFKLKPTKKEGWINVWRVSQYASPENAIAHGSYIYATKEEALSANTPARQLEVIATIKVEWEE